MPPVSILLNVLWIVFGGLYMALGWVIAGIIMAITIIGLPWAKAAFTIAAYALLPFGQTAVRRDSLTGRPDIGTGPLGPDRQFDLAGAGRLVAGARACGHRRGACGDHYRHSLCLGASQACGSGALADRQGNRSDLKLRF